MPTDAALALSTQGGPANPAAATPVDVKVVRSITYLGLDPTTRGVDPAQASTAAPTTAAATDPSKAGAPAAPPSRAPPARAGWSGLFDGQAATSAPGAPGAASAGAPARSTATAGATAAQSDGLAVTPAPAAPGGASVSAPARSASTAGATAAQAEGRAATSAPAGSANAQANSSTTSNGDNPPQNFRGSGGEHAASKVARASAPAQDGQTASAPAAEAPAAPAADAVSRPSQVDANATAPNSAGSVQLGQLGDVIASAASELESQAADAPTTVNADGGANGARTAPVKELDVQLNPASLGAVTIQMRLTDGKLAVTIKADRPDTVKLIENERGSLSDKLQSLNFSVESVTVKPSDAPTSASAHDEASNSGTTGNGDAQQGQPGQADGGARGGRSLAGDGERRQPAEAGGNVAGEPGGRDDLGERFF
jgi:flagellar hook-length control protein FliK